MRFSNPDLRSLTRTQLPSLVYRSDPEASRTLAKDDVVKIQLGAHIDGFAAISAETVVIGANAENPVTGRRADVIKAAWTAAEAAMRTVKVGNKNWAVTEVVGRSADAFHCKPVEGLFKLFHHSCFLADCLTRHVVLPTDSECHRRKEAYHLKPQRGAKARL